MTAAPVLSDAVPFEAGALPIFLSLAGLGVLILGDDGEATGKLRLAARAGARVTVVSAAPGAQLLDAIGECGATLLRRDFTPEDLAGQTLCFVALPPDAAETPALVAEARGRGVLVNAVDRPALCDFIIPAIIDRAPIVIAISTGGAAPALARDLRRRIEAMVAPGYSRLAQFCRRWRERVAAALPDAARRRRFWDAVIDGPEAADILRGAEADADAALMRRLAAAEIEAALPPAGRVSLVGIGPGDPELMTLKALRTLQQADVILHDRLVDRRVLDLARRGARRVEIDPPGTSGDERAMLEAARRGEHVVRLVGGDGRCARPLRDSMAAAGLPVEIVPGVDADVDIGPMREARGAA